MMSERYDMTSEETANLSFTSMVGETK